MVGCEDLRGYTNSSPLDGPGIVVSPRPRLSLPPFEYGLRPLQSFTLTFVGVSKGSSLDVRFPSVLPRPSPRPPYTMYLGNLRSLGEDGV